MCEQPRPVEQEEVVESQGHKHKREGSSSKKKSKKKHKKHKRRHKAESPETESPEVIEVPRPSRSASDSPLLASSSPPLSPLLFPPLSADSPEDISLPASQSSHVASSSSSSSSASSSSHDADASNPAVPPAIMGSKTDMKELMRQIAIERRNRREGGPLPVQKPAENNTPAGRPTQKTSTNTQPSKAVDTNTTNVGRSGSSSRNSGDSGGSNNSKSDSNITNGSGDSDSKHDVHKASEPQRQHAPMFLPKPVKQPQQQQQQSNLYTSDPSYPRKELKLLTFNIWFDEKAQSTRMHALGSLIERECPDIFAFQEVSPPLAKLLAAQPWYKHYFVSPGIPGHPYYTILGSRVRPIDMQRIPFENSIMGRDVLICSVSLPTIHGSQNITVACTHLESQRKFGAVREKQLQASLQLLSKAKQGSDFAVLMGDMNAKGPELNHLIAQADWRDAWIAAHPQDKGFTCDNTVNSNLEQGYTYRARLDRVYFRSSGSAPQLEDIRIVGDSPCSKTVTPHLFISDHFGLITTFTIPPPQDSAQKMKSEGEHKTRPKASRQTTLLPLVGKKATSEGSGQGKAVEETASNGEGQKKKSAGDSKKAPESGSENESRRKPSGDSSSNSNSNSNNNSSNSNSNSGHCSSNSHSSNSSHSGSSDGSSRRGGDRSKGSRAPLPVAESSSSSSSEDDMTITSTSKTTKTTSKTSSTSTKTAIEATLAATALKEEEEHNKPAARLEVSGRLGAYAIPRRYQEPPAAGGTPEKVREAKKEAQHISSFEWRTTKKKEKA